MEKAKRYAHIDNPSIAAIVHEMYRLDTAQEAAFKIVELTQHFIAGKKQIRNEEHPSLILWIKGYALSDAEKKAGYLGHYAVIAPKKIGPRHTIAATKMDAPLKDHPQRAQQRRENPNWGHPVLRSARKGKLYGSVEAAQAELDLLHEHFPGVSIPNPGKLYIMIYCSDRPARERLVKHVLTLKHNEAQNGYYIEIQENSFKPRRLPVRPAVAPAQPPQGKFTAKVAMTRKKKRPSGNSAPPA